MALEVLTLSAVQIQKWKKGQEILSYNARSMDNRYLPDTTKHHVGGLVKETQETRQESVIDLEKNENSSFP